jgi:hypothetical protein
VTVTEDCTTRLEGEVASCFAREQAEDVVARVQGVTCIENLIDVSCSVPRWSCADNDWDPIRHDFDFDDRTVRLMSDREFGTDIENELSWPPFVDVGEVRVPVEDGGAPLTVTIDDWNERVSASASTIEGGAAGCSTTWTSTSSAAASRPDRPGRPARTTRRDRARGPPGCRCAPRCVPPAGCRSRPMPRAGQARARAGPGDPGRQRAIKRGRTGCR